MKKQPLLQNFNNIDNLPLKNRIVMAPMTRSRANNEGNYPTEDLQGLYYAQRASAGLIITEGSQVSKEAVGYINTPGIYSDQQIAGWQKVTEKVHKNGGNIFIQLWHVGRISHPDFHNGNLPLAPSAINPNEKVFTFDGEKKTVTPKEMTKEDIKRTVNDFKNAAKNAMDSGFDGVEIHSSNGYLFHQFFNKSSNKRTDEYGGSIENRARFFFEVLEAIKEVLPDQKIGARFNPSLDGLFGMKMDNETIPTFEYVIKKLNNYNLAYVHLSEPFTDVSDIPYAIQNIAAHFRPLYNGTLMINGGFNQELGNKVLENGYADLVAFGKPFISNPDLAERFEKKLELTDWNKDTFYTPGPEGYTDYKNAEKNQLISS
ncbi:alkene reductase [Polaribacter sp. M15]